jgi:Tfp pilus assembly protein PilF
MSTQVSPPTKARGRGWRRLLLIVVLVLIAVGLYPLGRYIWASSHYRSALSAIDRKDFTEARRHLDVCCREWPNSEETRFIAARTARRAGDLEAAQRLLKDAQRLGWVPEEIELEQSLIAVQQNDYQAYKRRLYALVRNNHPDSLFILEVLSPIAVRNVDLQLAADCIDRWAKLDPTNPRPIVLMGDIMKGLQDPSNAVRKYKEAVSLAPDSVETRLKLGQALLDERLPDEAKEQFDWLGQHDPNNPAVRVGIARVDHLKGQDDQARVILDQLLSEREDNAEALALLGQIDLQANKPEVAEKLLTRALKLAPNDLQIMFSLALSLDQQNKSEEAEKIRARRKQCVDDQVEIVKLMRSLIKDSNDAETRRQIGIRLIRTGLPEQGLNWLISALAADPRHIPTHESLIEYYDQHGNPKLAEEHRQVLKVLKQRKK